MASGAKPIGADAQPLATVNISSDENVSYRSGSGMTMATNRPILKAAMQVLAENYSSTIPFDHLRKAAREKLGGDPTEAKLIAEDTNMIAVGILNCYMSSDLVELHGTPIAFCKKPGDHPTALPWARIQAAKQTVVTNRRHEVIRTNDLDKQLLPLLDGVNTRPQIIEKLTECAAAGLINVQKDGISLQDPKDIKVAITSILDQAITNVGAQGLLVA